MSSSRGKGVAAAQEGGSSSNSGGVVSNTLDVMRAPSSTTPDVVVPDSIPEQTTPEESLNLREDLWLSTVDGRYNSPIIPLRVGQAPTVQTFYVHKDVLTKTEYFRKALCGQFMESEAQAIDLPEEDPSTFHFLVAFLYENRYMPIRPIANVLDPELEKGKNVDASQEASGSDSDSDSSVLSDSSAQSRRRRDRRRRREDRRLERIRQKHPGSHRPNCLCPQCLAASGPPCWNCNAPRALPLPPPIIGIDVRTRRQQRRRGPNAPEPAGNGNAPPTNTPDPNGGGRIQGEDLRTWLMAYELNLDVYICANKFLMDGFKRAVANSCIDMLETAGSDAAQPEVLRLCKKLYHGVSESDPLLKMVFARLGFLQPLLWQRATEETSDFLVSNPEVAALMLRETTARREEDNSGRHLPSMERSRILLPPPPIYPRGPPPPPQRMPPPPMRRW